mmetsp:Transcript_45657/g.145401  ORF Transcript_45657/g.145401 Transcript_45657/m.145401 type:complete len:294 (-) Transcript_45657:141-1022(-)
MAGRKAVSEALPDPGAHSVGLSYTSTSGRAVDDAHAALEAPTDRSRVLQGLTLTWGEENLEGGGTLARAAELAGARVVEPGAGAVPHGAVLVVPQAVKAPRGGGPQGHSITEAQLIGAIIDGSAEGITPLPPPAAAGARAGRAGRAGARAADQTRRGGDGAGPSGETRGAAEEEEAATQDVPGGGGVVVFADILSGPRAPASAPAAGAVGESGPNFKRFKKGHNAAPRNNYARLVGFAENAYSEEGAASAEFAAAQRRAAREEGAADALFAAKVRATKAPAAKRAPAKPRARK